MVENNEPDTIKYQFYLNRCETKCMVHETYTNSESVLANITGVASKTILLKIFNIAKICGLLLFTLCMTYIFSKPIQFYY